MTDYKPGSMDALLKQAYDAGYHAAWAPERGGAEDWESIQTFEQWRESLVADLEPEAEGEPVLYEEPVLLPETVRDFLLLVEAEFPGETPSEETIATWAPEVQSDVVDWASAVHLVASDNDVEIPPMPAVLAAKEPCAWADCQGHDSRHQPACGNTRPHRAHTVDYAGFKPEPWCHGVHPKSA